jgi:hypothetical protein
MNIHSQAIQMQYFSLDIKRALEELLEYTYLFSFWIIIIGFRSIFAILGIYYAMNRSRANGRLLASNSFLKIR